VKTDKVKREKDRVSLICGATMFQFHRHVVAGVGCAFFGVLGVMGSACASCPLNAQCVVDDGSSQNIEDKSLKSAGTHPKNAALVVGNGSSVNGKNLELAAPLDSYSFGAYVHSGASVNLKDSTITGMFGIESKGAGTVIHMQGGRIETINSAVRIADGATITLDHVDLESTSKSAVIQSHPSGSGANIYIIGGSVTYSAARDPQTGPAAAIGAGRGKTFIDGTKITSTSGGVQAFGGGPGVLSQLEMKNFSVATTEHSSHGINVNSRAIARLEKAIITTTGEHAKGIIVYSGEDSALYAKDISITTQGYQAHGVQAINSTSRLEDLDITIEGAANGLHSYGGNQGVIHSRIEMDGGKILIKGSGGKGAFVQSRASVALDRVELVTQAASTVGLDISWGGRGSFTNGTMDIKGDNARALSLFSNTEAIIADSQIKVAGKDALGVVFRGTSGTNKAVFKNSGLDVADSYALVANGGTNRLELENSHIEGRELIFAGSSSQQGSNLEVNAHSSKLVGYSTLSKESRLSFNLTEGSEWMLRPSNAGQTGSELSYLYIDGSSSVVFDVPVADKYQTLRVGAGDIDGANSLVYQAKKGARISLNTKLNEGGKLENQFTDRLLIEGDVAGQTLVDIKQMAGSQGGLTSPDEDFLHDQGISIIQVSGKAAENSFVLSGGYVALNGTPYQYRLYAYGEGSQYGLADEKQRLVAGAEPHWDWRLQSVMQDGGGLVVAPQIPTYLVAANALFRAGLVDIASLNQRLGPMRSDGTGDGGSVMQDFFIRTYGGKYDYISNLSSTAYGYDFDMRYQAMQAGAGLVNFETNAGNVRFGLNGAYGDLNFEPRQVAGSVETNIDLWHVAPTLTWLGNNQAYIDVIVAAGGFEGHVATTQRGRTTKLSGHRLNVSIEAGMPLMSTSQGWSVEPQAQLVYQSLAFDQTQDVDGFAVKLGHLDQWTLTAGSEIKRSVSDEARNRDILLYGSLHLAHTFGDRHQIWLGDKFNIGRFGTHLEGIIGMQVNFVQKIALYADVNWTAALGSSGHSGLGINGGTKISF